MIANVLSFLMTTWVPSYQKWALYKEATSIESATHIMIDASKKKKVFCSIDTATRFKSEEHDIEEAKSILYMKKKYFVVDVNNSPTTEGLKTSKYRNVGICEKNPVALVTPAKSYVSKPLSFYKKKLTDLQGWSCLQEANNALQVSGKNE